MFWTVLFALLGLLWLVSGVAVWLWFKPEVFGLAAPVEGQPESWLYAFVLAICVAVPLWNTICALRVTFPEKAA